jgi:hypothetical protein
MASGEPKEPIKGTYQHFKGGLYEVLGVAEDPETGNRYVVYQSLGLTENILTDPGPGNHFATDERLVKTPTKGALAVCSVKRFSELVDGKEYHPGQRVPRFRLRSPTPRG